MCNFRNTNKCATILCVQYLITNHMNNKSPIKRDDLMKTVFKGRVTGKNFENVMNDVDNTLKNVLLKFYRVLLSYVQIVFEIMTFEGVKLISIQSIDSSDVLCSEIFSFFGGKGVLSESYFYLHL